MFKVFIYRNAQRVLSARIGRKVIISADSDSMPNSTAAKSGFMANQPMAKSTPAVDKSFAKASMLSPTSIRRIPIKMPMYRRWKGETIGLAADYVSAKSYTANRLCIVFTHRKNGVRTSCPLCVSAAPAPTVPAPPDTFPSPVHTNRRCRVRSRYDSIHHCRGAQAARVLSYQWFWPYG